MTTPLFSLSDSALAYSELIESLLFSVNTRLSNWFNRADYLTQAAIAFDAKAGSTKWEKTALELKQNLLSGSYGVRLEVRSGAEMGGAYGAFSGTGTTGQPTIYLNGDWLARASTQQIEAVLIEELGHSFDQVLNGTKDSAGDEGEAFANLVFNPTANVSFIKQQNDQQTIKVGGVEVLVEAAGGDFSIDFAAAEPTIYSRETGGGAFEDKTINVDAVESLEGGDFAVGDLVSWYFNVSTLANAVDQFAQTIEVDVSFLVNTTGQTGVSIQDIVNVSANYYTGEITGGIIRDTAIIDDDATIAFITPGTEIYENKVTGVVYDGNSLDDGVNGAVNRANGSINLTNYKLAAADQGAVVSASIRITDLEPGENVVLRIDTLLGALAGSTPTGNLQGFVTGARVISATDDPVINLGNQTIPFKLTPEITGIPKLSPGITVEKVVTKDLLDLSVTYNTNIATVDYTGADARDGDAAAYFADKGTESITIADGQTVRYIYKLTNTGNVTLSLVDLYDDNGTIDPADDIFIFGGLNGDSTIWNRKLTRNNANEVNVTKSTAAFANINGITLLGSGFIDDTKNVEVLSALEDLDGDNKTDPNSLDGGNTIYVFYDVRFNKAPTGILSLTNTATAAGVIDPNGGGQSGTLISDTDTANVKLFGANATYLSGYTYLDLDNNGVKGPNETGIAGALIEVKNGTTGSTVATTRTDLTGKYEFTGLSASTNYTITQTQPAGYFDGKDGYKQNAGSTVAPGTVSDNSPAPGTVNPSGANDTISSVTLTAGKLYENYNFGEILPASISGTAYIDLIDDNNTLIFTDDLARADGDRQDTETGRAGVLVRLSGVNDLGFTVNFTVLTDSSGRYYFGDLRPSNNSGYEIRFGNRDGSGNGTDPGIVGIGDIGTITTALGELSLTPGINGNNDNITGIILGAGSNGVNYDFGLPVSNVGGVISGTVYQDTGIYSGATLTGTDNGLINDISSTNFSTTPSTGEKRIAGVTITLYNSNNQVVATTKTDVNGNYSFTNLPNGTYSVVEDQPQYFDPSKNNGNGGFVDYLDGKESKDINFNGRIDPTGEVITNSNTTDTISGLTIDNTNKNLIGNNFGELPPASISGYVFIDTKRNRDFGLIANQSVTVDGITYATPTTGGNADKPITYTIPVRNAEFDNNEFGIAGVTIRLTGNNDLGPVDITTTTDANGYYRFDGLRPSDANGYIVTQSQPSGYEDGLYDNGTNNNVASTNPYTFSASEVNTGNVLGRPIGIYADPAPAAPNVYQDNFSGIKLNLGQSGIDYNFPEALPSTRGLITGKVYLDAGVDANNDGTPDNGSFDDGIYQVGEIGLGGILITLDNGATTRTDADGNYFFNVAAGTYTITQSQPAAYDNGKDSTGNTGQTSQTDNFISNVTVAGGGINANNNFGELIGSISGNVKADTNNDNAGDINLLGIKVELLSGTTVIASTLTNTAGNYSFANVKAGSYTVRQTNLAGYADVTDTQGSINDSLIAVSLLAGQNSLNNNFVDKYLPSSISGYVYDDRFGDTIGDFDTATVNPSGTNDKGIAGVTIKLIDAGRDGLFLTADDVSYTTITNANGYYVFNGLSASLYRIEETDLSGYTSVKDVDNGLANQIGNVQLAAGQNVIDKNFLDKSASGSISGNVFDDRFGSTPDVFDGNDKGIFGVTINLQWAGPDDIWGNSDDVTNITTTTGIDGSYTFSDLRPGKYRLLETDLDNYDSVLDVDDTDKNNTNNTPTNPDGFIDNINLGAGNAITGKDFLDVQNSSVPEILFSKQVSSIGTNGNSFISGIPENITYQIKLKNASAALSVTNVKVKDLLVSANLLTPDSGDSVNPGVLDAQEEWIFNETIPVNSALINTFVNPLATLESQLPSRAKVLLNPATVNIYSLLPGGERDSYVDGFVSDPTLASQTILNGYNNFWCVDVDRTVWTNYTFNALLYSTYNTAIPSSYNVDKPQNLDLVNWVLNQDYIGAASDYNGTDFTAGDVQYAIWKLIDNNISTLDLGPFDVNRANEIVLDATNFQGLTPDTATVYTPGLGETLAVLVIPLSPRGSYSGRQKMILEVDLPRTAVLTNTAEVSYDFSNTTYEQSATVNTNIILPAGGALEQPKNVNLVGNIYADALVGGDGDDTLTGLTGGDTLTGGGGIDNFIYKAGDSIVTATDTITDFVIGTDKIKLLDASNNTITPANFTRAANQSVNAITTTTLTTLVESVFADANGTATVQPLATNSAALVQVGVTGSSSQTYLVVNDGVSGFQSANDLLINITDYNGILPNFGAITPNTFFA